MQRDGLGAQHRSGHAWQRGILGPANRNATLQCPPAGNAKFIHDGNRLE